MAAAAHTDHYDVIVVGVGTMGSATVDHLARRGARVLGLERSDPIGHERGSAGGDNRLIRKAYYEHPDYVPLLLRAYDNWRDLEARTGEQVLFETGTVYIGDDVIGGSRDAAEAHGLRYEMLSPTEVTERCGPFTTDQPAMFEPDGGFVLSTPSIRLFAEQARQHGAEILTNVSVLGWDDTGSSVEVTTSSGTFTADHLVVTAGAWAPELLADLGVELTVTRQVLYWLRPPDPAPFELGRFSCWAADVAGYGGVFYGFPMSERGLKVAHHCPGRPTAPGDIEPPDEDDFAPVRDALEQLLPGALGPVADAATCLYTVSSDEHFVIDRHPRCDRVIVACGFSGHGFKFASVIGEVLADLATEGGTDLPIGFLGLDRL